MRFCRGCRMWSIFLFARGVSWAPIYVAHPNALPMLDWNFLGTSAERSWHKRCALSYEALRKMLLNCLEMSRLSLRVWNHPAKFPPNFLRFFIASKPTLNIFWGKIFPPEGKLGEFSLREKIFPLRDNFSLEISFPFPSNGQCSHEMKGLRNGVFMAWGKMYDFPPRGEIYLKPFFCLKRCYGKTNSPTSFRSRKMFPGMTGWKITDFIVG